MTAGNAEWLERQVPMFRGFSPRTRELVASRVVPMSFAPGDVVAEGSEPCGGVPVVVSGRLKVTQPNPGGREILLFELGPREACTMGLGCALSARPYQVRAVATEPTRLLMLPADLVQTLVREEPAFQVAMLGEVIDRMQELLRLVDALAFQQVDRRLGRYLLERPSPIHATHQVIADDLGTAREIVSRLLGRFAAEGWVESGRERILVRNGAEMAKALELENYGSVM